MTREARSAALLKSLTSSFKWSFVTPTLCKDLFYSCFIFFVNEPSLSNLDGFVCCVIIKMCQIKIEIEMKLKSKLKLSWNLNWNETEIDNETETEIEIETEFALKTEIKIEIKTQI